LTDRPTVPNARLQREVLGSAKESAETISGAVRGASGLWPARARCFPALNREWRCVPKK